MSGAPRLLQSFAARLARALSFEGHGLDRATGEEKAVATPAERAAVRPPSTEYSERELEERKREIRILMATWM